MRLYNTLTRTIEDFRPLNPPTVTMYVCGPTVYDEPHIGHVRSAYIFDVLRRHLESTGHRVTFIRNVTDVDDKIIQKAQELGESPTAVADRYLARYHDVLNRLGLGEPTKEPKATEHLDAMRDLISELVVKGAAYDTKGGDVYFAVRKFPNYGRLSNRTLDELKAGTRIEPGEDKHDPLDFALWKAAKPGEPSWSSPWGQGRPGWHIECTAMSTKFLGDTFDIHGGGLDLIFPHHENEIAQAHAVGKPFAKWWVHHGLVTVNGEKMSKSMNNYVTLDEVLKECDDNADVLKFLFLSSLYRSPLDYNLFALNVAKKMLGRVETFIRQAVELTVPNRQELEHFTLKDVVDAHLTQFQAALDSDLNTVMSLAAIFELISFVNENAHKLPDSNRACLLYYSANGVKRLLRELFGLKLKVRVVLTEKLNLIDDVGVSISPDMQKEIKALVDEREKARSKKDYMTADQIRLKLLEKGIAVEDTSEGPKLRFVSQ